MPVTFLDPGRLNASIDLEAATGAPDGQGGAALSWNAVATVWARIEPMAFGFDETAGQMRGALTHRIWIRARDGVAEGMRFVRGTRIFVIRAIRDPDESGRYLVCLCQEDAL